MAARNDVTATVASCAVHGRPTSTLPLACGCTETRPPARGQMEHRGVRVSTKWCAGPREHCAQLGRPAPTRQGLGHPRRSWWDTSLAAQLAYPSFSARSMSLSPPLASTPAASAGAWLIGAPNHLLVCASSLARCGALSVQDSRRARRARTARLASCLAPHRDRFAWPFGEACLGLGPCSVALGA